MEEIIEEKSNGSKKKKKIKNSLINPPYFLLKWMDKISSTGLWEVWISLLKG